MLEPAKFNEQLVNYYKDTLDNSFAVMSAIQKHTEKMMELLLQQNKWFPEESKNTLKDMFSAYHKNCGELKKFMDEGFKKLIDFCVPACKVQ
jgi:hypothetical protein